MRRVGVLAVLAVGLAAGLGGCRTPSSETIQVAYGEELERLEPGMPAEAFERLIPEAELFQKTFTSVGTISVYRLDHLYKQSKRLPTEEQTLYFRFVNGELNRWGYSRTWGDRAGG